MKPFHFTRTRLFVIAMGIRCSRHNFRVKHRKSPRAKPSQTVCAKAENSKRLSEVQATQTLRLPLDYPGERTPNPELTRSAFRPLQIY
jgi:hypothetical protein